MRILLTALLSLCLMSMPAYAALTVDSVVALTSTCQNNGSITVYAHGPSALSYSLKAGPITYAAQQGNVFSALPSGVYALIISDASGDTTSQSVSVGGSYTLPNFTPYVSYPACLQTMDYEIIGHLTPGSGSGPFVWQFVRPSPLYLGPQASDTFHVPYSATYTISCTDACGNVQTRQFTFTDPGESNITLNDATEDLVGCDSVRVSITADVSLDSTKLSFPYTLTLDNGQGTVLAYTQITHVSSAASGTWTFRQNGSQVVMGATLPRVAWGHIISETITDGCGDTVSDRISLQGTTSISFSNTWTTFSAGNCQVSNGNDFTYTMPKPNNWIVTNIHTHAVLSTGINQPDSALSSSNDIFLSQLPADSTYLLTVYDHCGDTLTTTILWPEAYVTPRYYSGAEIFACLDSTSSEDISYTGYSSGMTLEVLSGPPGAHSSKPGYEYNYTYTYPRVFRNPATDGDFHLTDLAPGIYVYTIHDSCGNTNTDSFNINPAFLVTFSRTFTYLRGCRDANTLVFQFLGDVGTFATINLDATIVNAGTGATIFSQSLSGHNIYDSVYNIPAGTYILSAEYADVGYNMTDSDKCSHVIDTVIVLPYQNPALAAVTDIICGGTIYISALMDSSTGVAPYSYQLISGPQVTSLQGGRTFTVTQYGTYTLLALDACGNSTTQSITIDSLAGGVQHVATRTDSCFHATIGGQTYSSDAVLVDTIRNALGCDSVITTDSIYIRGNNDSLPIITSPAAAFCITTGGTLSAAHHYAAYQWSDGSTTPVISVATAGTYAITITDADGCLRADVATVSFVDSPYVTSGWITDTAVCPDAPADIILTVNDSSAHYLWSPPGKTPSGLTRTIVDSGVYTFTISNSCASSTYTLIAAAKEFCYEYLYVPNAFTPNGDGINDLFQVFTDYKLKLTSLQVFDRWGEKVYDGSDETQGWDGTYRGAQVPPGTYVYQLDATWIGGNTMHRRGSITLIR